MKTKCKITVLIICLLVVIVLPFFAGIIAKPLFGRKVLDKPEFWYGYMAYFGTVALAGVALYQNIKADEANKRLLVQQLRQKIGYLRLTWSTEKDWYKSDDVTLEKNGASEVIWIHVKNVGEDIILQAQINSITINSVPTKAFDNTISVIYKDEPLYIPIALPDSIDCSALKVEMLASMKNTASVVYEQKLSITLRKRSGVVETKYIVESFDSDITFPED